MTMTRKEASILHGVCEQLFGMMGLGALAHKFAELYYTRAKNPQPGDFVLIRYVLKPDPVKVLGWLKEGRRTGMGWYVIECLDGTEVRWENVECVAIPLCYMATPMMGGKPDEIEEAFRVTPDKLLQPVGAAEDDDG